MTSVENLVSYIIIWQRAVCACGSRNNNCLAWHTIFDIWREWQLSIYCEKQTENQWNKPTTTEFGKTCRGMPGTQRFWMSPVQLSYCYFLSESMKIKCISWRIKASGKFLLPFSHFCKSLQTSSLPLRTFNCFDEILSVLMKSSTQPSLFAVFNWKSLNISGWLCKFGAW